MLVRYDKENIWGIGIPIGGKKTRTGNTPLGSRLVTLTPGVNRIEDGDWSRIKDHPKVLYALEEGYLEVVTEKQGEAEKTDEGLSSPDLAGMLVKDAVGIIKDCLNLDLLEKWRGEDSRVGVQKAVADQLKKLELTPEEREAMKG